MTNREVCVNKNLGKKFVIRAIVVYKRWIVKISQEERLERWNIREMQVNLWRS